MSAVSRRQLRGVRTGSRDRKHEEATAGPRRKEPWAQETEEKKAPTSAIPRGAQARRIHIHVLCVPHDSQGTEPHGGSGTVAGLTPDPGPQPWATLLSRTNCTLEGSSVNWGWPSCP